MTSRIKEFKSTYDIQLANTAPRDGTVFLALYHDKWFPTFYKKWNNIETVEEPYLFFFKKKNYKSVEREGFCLATIHGHYWAIYFSGQGGFFTHWCPMPPNELEMVSSIYNERLNYLRSEGTINSKSEEDFCKFYKKIKYFDLFEIVLVDDNIRITWEKNTNNFVGLEFMGDGIIRYVFFRKEIFDENDDVFRLAGSANFDEISQLLRQHDMLDIMCNRGLE